MISHDISCTLSEGGWSMFKQILDQGCLLCSQELGPETSYISVLFQPLALTLWHFPPRKKGRRFFRLTRCQGNLQTWTVSILRAARNPTVRDHLKSEQTALVSLLTSRTKSKLAESEVTSRQTCNHLTRISCLNMSKYWYPWILVIIAVVDTIRHHKSSCVSVCL